MKSSILSAVVFATALTTSGSALAEDGSPSGAFLDESSEAF